LVKIQKKEDAGLLKYSFATPPAKVYVSSLQQTIAASCPSTMSCIDEDYIKRIFHKTLTSGELACKYLRIAAPTATT
jgi:hypothetical protein